jgi:hypothetical protein
MLVADYCIALCVCYIVGVGVVLFMFMLGAELDQHR